MTEPQDSNEAVISANEIRTFLGVAAQSVYNWSDEYADFMNPLATPKKGTARYFTLDDVRVLAYVSANSRSKSQHIIRTEVEQGMRGLVEFDSAADFQEYVARMAGDSKDTLQNQLALSNVAIQTLQSDKRALEDEIIRLKTRLEIAEGQALDRDGLLKQIARLEYEIEMLKRE